MSSQTALILSGGGARGAYQVGVLKGLAEIIKTPDDNFPFQIISGTSAGSLNAGHLAASPHNFKTSVDSLIKLWSELKPDKVFKTDLLALNKSILPGIFRLGSAQKPEFNSFLDTGPLKKLINDNCDFSLIQKNIDSKKLQSLIITTNNYISGIATSFIQTSQNTQTEKSLWKDSRRTAVYSKISTEHILASTAIPLLFPPVSINNQAHGDGCVRNNTPCSPSIRMGADKLFVIGVRTQKNFENIESKSHNTNHRVSIIRIINTLLNAVMLDSVEQDVYRIQRINELVDSASAKHRQEKGLKKIPALCISPTQNIGEIARERAHHLPRILRMTIGAFGNLDEASEMMSYLMFESDFCKKLIEIGYEDALNSKEEILQFMET